MRELTYFVAISLDGRIASPDGDFSAFPVEGDHIGMIMRDYRDTLPAPALDALGLTADNSRFDTVVMGWETYAAGLPVGVDNPYPHLEQIIATRSHAHADLPESIRTTDDPVAEVRRLKQREGAGIWLCGGGTLAATLIGEIDRLVFKVNPIVLSDGIPAFAGSYDPCAWDLTHSTAYQSGVVVNEYVRN
jgi:dihydrofolate reductase